MGKVKGRKLFKESFATLEAENWLDAEVLKLGVRVLYILYRYLPECFQSNQIMACYMSLFLSSGDRLLETYVVNDILRKGDSLSVSSEKVLEKHSCEVRKY